MTASNDIAVIATGLGSVAFDLSQRARERFAYMVSEKAARDELRFQRVLGAEWIDAYTRAWKVSDEVAELVYSEDRPAMQLPAKMISNPNSKGLT